MLRPRQSLLPLLLLGLLSSCTSEGPGPPGQGIQLLLDRGGFVPRTGIADLRGSPALPAENPALWLPQPAVGLEGWESAGRGWHPQGDRSILRFWRRAAAGSALSIDFHHRVQDPLKIGVSLNGDVLGSLEAGSGRARFRVPLPLGLLAEVNEFQFDFEPPLELSAGPPQLSLLRIGVQDRASQEKPVPLPSGFEPTPSGGIEIDRSGVYVIPCDLPADVSRVSLRARNLGSGLVSHRFSVSGLGDRRTELLSGQLSETQWQVLDSGLEGWQGQQVIFTWEVELPNQGERVELGQISLQLSEMEPSPSDPVEEVASGSQPLPDVVVIVLDAARGDRFPGWDYPRRTMPILQDLGRSSLSFRSAFSECPTTSCSIPAMITGVPFLPGGEVGGGTQLAEEVTTLAESLKARGYATVGFSATPNNSASHNLDQGFEVFRELWGRDNPDHGPFNMSRLAADVIANQPEDVPLFLQLHYLPPHQPYDPGPEFNQFTDPDYSGPIRPDMSLKPFSLGQQQLGPTDLNHLIGLYDGNLSVADAAVGQVLDALKSAGRFENSLIVITSDHGEAFMEHGRQGHNTTLFDEMLHVPLMIRLPGGVIPESFESDRLASTLDIVPTILGFVGGEVDPRVGGLDLLQTRTDPLRPRILFFRTSHPKNAMLAARTSTWKAISWPRHQVQMLFHLDQDPGETVNLVGEWPLVYAALGLRTRRHLQIGTDLQLEGLEVEVTEEAEETLRALGYLN